MTSPRERAEARGEIQSGERVLVKVQRPVAGHGEYLVYDETRKKVHMFIPLGDWPDLDTLMEKHLKVFVFANLDDEGVKVSLDLRELEEDPGW